MNHEVRRNIHERSSNSSVTTPRKNGRKAVTPSFSQQGRRRDASPSIYSKSQYHKSISAYRKGCFCCFWIHSLLCPTSFVPRCASFFLFLATWRNFAFTISMRDSARCYGCVDLYCISTCNRIVARIVVRKSNTVVISYLVYVRDPTPSLGTLVREARLARQDVAADRLSRLVGPRI